MSPADHELLAQAHAHGWPSRFGLVLHIGATRGDLELHEQLASSSRVLVQGDPACRADLERALQDQDCREPAWRMWPDAVAADASTLEWHHYNVRSLNGPLDMAPLSQLFPRLQLLGTSTLVASPVSEVAQRALALADGADKSAPALLILDVPGQGGALLSALGPALLRRFTWLIVRACSPEIDMTSGDTARRRDALEAACFQIVAAAGTASGWCSSELARFDAAADALQRALARAETAEAAAVKLADELAACEARRLDTESRLMAAAAQGHEQTARLDELARQLDQAQTAFKSQAETRALTLAEADRAKAEHAAQAGRLQATMVSIQDRCDELQAKLAIAQQQRESDWAGRAAIESQLAAATARAAAADRTTQELRQQADTLSAALEATREAVQAETRRVHEQSQRADRHAAAAQEVRSSLAAQEAGHRQALAALQQQIDELQAQHAERRAAAEADSGEQLMLKAAVEELRRELAEQQARWASAQAELQSRQSALDEVRQQLQGALANTASTRSQLAESNTSLEHALAERASLQKALDDQRLRQSALAEELRRAEAQLDLVKDLLLVQRSLP